MWLRIIVIILFFFFLFYLGFGAFFFFSFRLFFYSFFWAKVITINIIMMMVVRLNVDLRLGMFMINDFLYTYILGICLDIASVVEFISVQLLRNIIVLIINSTHTAITSQLLLLTIIIPARITFNFCEGDIKFLILFLISYSVFIINAFYIIATILIIDVLTLVLRILMILSQGASVIDKR